VTQNTEYVVGATRFSIPAEKDRDVPIDSYKENFAGKISFVKVEPENGRMNLDFQVQVPAYNYDLARPGKGPSADWVFFTTYNTEQAHTMLEINASQADKDFILAVNWRKAEAGDEGRRAPRARPTTTTTTTTRARARRSRPCTTSVLLLDPRSAGRRSSSCRRRRARTAWTSTRAAS
jgi:nitrous-oxide reductase